MSMAAGECLSARNQHADLARERKGLNENAEFWRDFWSCRDFRTLSS
jgi:hypothetical protein